MPNYQNYQAQSCSGGAQSVVVRVDTDIFGTPVNNQTAFNAPGIQGCYRFVAPSLNPYQTTVTAVFQSCAICDNPSPSVTPSATITPTITPTPTPTPSHYAVR